MTSGSSQPNILVILTDQQSAHLLSCAGNPYLATPAMDSLAARGMRFSRTYCTNPVCLPARFSLMSGRMPSALGIRCNATGAAAVAPAALRQAAPGHRLTAAGYDCAYAGKVHLPQRYQPVDMGFTDLGHGDGREAMAATSAAFIRQARRRPFCLVSSFINPHDICYLAVRDHATTAETRGLLERGGTELACLEEALARPAQVSEAEFFAEHCPPLPANAEPQAGEPEAIEHVLAQRPFKRHAREAWTEAQWRLHRWAYCRLVERVDREIALVLDALCDSGALENTVIVFTSDHGDMDGSHRLEHKTVLYEEAARVPFLVCAPGGAVGQTDGTHLVSSGLDLLPTLYDYAGVAAAPELTGRSVRPLVEGKRTPWRAAVPVESECGRMVVSARHKYVLYDKGARREQFYDLAHDPGEMRNHLGDAAEQEALATHRAWFAEAFPGVAVPELAGVGGS